MSQNHQHLESVVEKLVHEYFEQEEKLEKIVWIKSDKPEIRLIEVNSQTITTGDVQSFYFPPSDEIPYALKLAEVTPDEWQRVLRNEIPLPVGWSLENHKVFTRELVTV
jgi:hypothetical protein